MFDGGIIEIEFEEFCEVDVFVIFVLIEFESVRIFGLDLVESGKIFYLFCWELFEIWNCYVFVGVLSEVFIDQFKVKCDICLWY